MNSFERMSLIGLILWIICGAGAITLFAVMTSGCVPLVIIRGESLYFDGIEVDTLQAHNLATATKHSKGEN